MAETWMVYHRYRVAHAVRHDVYPQPGAPQGTLLAMCGRIVYPLHVAEAGVRHCRQCTEKLPGASGERVFRRCSGV
jgi:hypothetical protein